MKHNYYKSVQLSPSWAGRASSDAYGCHADLLVNGVCQRFRWIEPGTFLMGSPEDEAERCKDELQHEVTLTKGFWLADTACTQALWMAVMDDNPSRFKDDPNNPVENVSWNDVQDFIEQLNRMFPELKARLPTEAQWEYACRAGTTTPFSFGENIAPKQVNYDGNRPYPGGARGINRGKTVPVKSLPVNPWGLYEMQGNVWEWCQDWYGGYSSEEVIDPIGPDTGFCRVLRGGSWFSYGRNSRSAERAMNDPPIRFGFFGFRFVLG